MPAPQGKGNLVKAPHGSLDISAKQNIIDGWMKLKADTTSNCAENVAFDYAIETKVGALLLYCYFANVVDYKMIEKISGMRVFEAGPHKDGQTVSDQLVGTESKNSIASGRAS